MGKIVLLEVSFLGGGRIATKNLIAVRMTAESRDHLFHVAGLLHQRPVNRLQVRGGFCGDLFAKPDEEIEALKVIGSLAMAEWQTMIRRNENKSASLSGVSADGTKLA